MASLEFLEGLAPIQTPHHLQYFPANIGFDGPAEVKSRFTDDIISSEPENGAVDEASRNLQATLRGRPLDGRVVRLPSGYAAMAVRRAGRQGLLGEVDGGEGVQLSVVEMTDRITVWNYDMPQSDESDNPISQALQFIRVGEALAKSGDDEAAQLDLNERECSTNGSAAVNGSKRKRD